MDFADIAQLNGTIFYFYFQPPGVMNTNDTETMWLENIYMLYNTVMKQLIPRWYSMNSGNMTSLLSQWIQVLCNPVIQYNLLWNLKCQR